MIIIKPSDTSTPFVPPPFLWSILLLVVMATTAPANGSSNEANVLFLGDQEAGRTSLISVIVNPNKG